MEFLSNGNLLSNPWGGGGCPLLKKSSGLKILDFSQLFTADEKNEEKKSKNLVLPPRRALFGHPVLVSMI